MSAAAEPVGKSPASGIGGLVLIGAYDLVKAGLFLVLALSLLRFVHRDVGAFASHMIKILHADPDNRYIHKLLVASDLVTPQQLEYAAAGSFFYAVLHAVEGVGLVLRRRWAELLTVLATGAFIPVEIYELIRHLTVLKVAVTAFNLFCIAYVWRQYKKRVAA